MSSLHNSDTAKHIIIVNVIIFVAVFYTPFSAYYEQLAMYYVDAPLFKPWQLLTHMFMHAGPLHIAMNMYGVFLFGRILERIWGSKRFLLFYFASGFGAALLYLFVEGLKFKLDPSLGTFFPYSAGFNPAGSSVVGASGAVFGILIAFAMLFPNTELMLLFIPFPIKAKYLIGAYVAYEIVNGYLSFVGSSNDGIAHFAHLGGALFGFIIVKYWQRQSDSFY